MIPKKEKFMKSGYSKNSILLFETKILDIEDATDMTLERSHLKDLLLMPGSTFMPDEKKPCPYLRLSYSFSSPQAMDEVSFLDTRKCRYFRKNKL